MFRNIRLSSREGLKLTTKIVHDLKYALLSSAICLLWTSMLILHEKRIYKT